MGAPRQLALHWQILAGMAAGLVVGVGLNVAAGPIGAAREASAAVDVVAGFVASLNGFVGDLFLRGLRFVAVPIVLFSLIVGASSLNDLRKLSRIGGRTVALYLGTTSLAITLGLVLANLAQPGRFVGQDVRDRLAASRVAEAAEKIGSAAAPDVWTTLLDVVPTNPFRSLADGEMLQVVFVALAVGIALTLVPRAIGDPVIQVANGLCEVLIKLVHLLMLAAPVAVFCLLAEVMASLGLDVLGALVVYSAVVVVGLLGMLLVVYPTLTRVGAGVGAGRLYRAIAPAQLLAFSSSSSSATLPVTLEVCETRLGVGRDVASFVLPLGATVNMDGTALYQGVATLFVTQLFGIHLGFGDQLAIVLTATLASIGTAGVPGVGLIMLVIVLQAVHVPPDVMQSGIAILFAVDRLLDMCRTVCNVTGDCAVATVVAAMEGDLLDEAALAARGDRPIDELP